MCGICGFVHHRTISEEILRIMNQTIKYRGPDDEGYFQQNIKNTDMQIGLAHNRLSILDLSSLGHQPMMSSDGNIVVCFNGEIYNYKQIRNLLQKKNYLFRSNCDTEVILYAYIEWGISCINQFNGMFAISLWDKRTNTLFLARDRMGVKPLFYYYNEGNLIFASELKPIMKYPFFKKELNEWALSEYLHYQYITGPDTIFKNTYKLEPGQLLKFSDGNIEISPYWSVTQAYTGQTQSNESYSDAKKHLKELLLDSVSLRMISDVPVGAFLSGGYDSTLIVSLMRELTSHTVKTFTVGFNEVQYNEAQYAEAVAKQLGTEHYCQYLPMEKAKAYLKDIPLYFDEPMADASQIATILLAKETREYVTVALSGDAGDELFCGYEKYSKCYDLYKYKNISKVLNWINCRVSLNGLLGKADSMKWSKLLYASKPVDVINADYYAFWDKYRDLINVVKRNNKYTEISELTEDMRMKYMLTDMITYLPDDILTKVDRATMAISLESRMPFLDYRVVEYSLSLPMNYKCENRNKKRILKDIAYDYVNKQYLDRPKQGFGVPVHEWLYEDFTGMTMGLLDTDYIKKQGIFNQSTIKSMVSKFKKVFSPETARPIWTLLVFQMWWDRYFEN